MRAPQTPLVRPDRPVQAGEDAKLSIGPHRIPMAFVRNPRARRYVLRLRDDGVARVTIPRGGSSAAAKAFAEANADWLARQLHRLGSKPPAPATWRYGTEILLRGEWVRLEAARAPYPKTPSLGEGSIHVQPGDGATLDLRAPVESWLWRLAQSELPPRVFELAAAHQLAVGRVAVRDQKTRWGSCSRRATISLNWRLIQAPRLVQDYIILHELMHLREMNHSPRFWREVARACPAYREAERWLKMNSRLVRTGR